MFRSTCVPFLAICVGLCSLAQGAADAQGKCQKGGAGGGMHSSSMQRGTPGNFAMPRGTGTSFGMMTPPYMQQGMTNPYLQRGMTNPYLQQGMTYPYGMQSGVVNPYMQQGVANPYAMQQAIAAYNYQRSLAMYNMQQGVNPYNYQSGVIGAAAQTYGSR